MGEEGGGNIFNSHDAGLFPLDNNNIERNTLMLIVLYNYMCRQNDVCSKWKRITLQKDFMSIKATKSPEDSFTVMIPTLST